MKSEGKDTQANLNAGTKCWNFDHVKFCRNATATILRLRRMDSPGLGEGDLGSDCVESKRL